jgi:hypothetical protein
MLRRQIALMSHAGIDVLIFDYSNAVTYDTQLYALCDMIRQMRLEGYPVPLKIVFLTHAGSAATATYLYNTLYSRNKYSDLWFYWQGKPLMLGYVNGLDATDPAPSAAVQNFFTWRQSWAWEGGLDKMAWIDSTTPQQFGYHDAPDHPESMPVTCGGWSAGNIGHSYTNRTQPSYDNYHLPVARTEGQGLFYAEQNAYGLKYDPQFLFITGWNEWIAGSFAANPAGSVSMLGNPCPLNGYYFVDEYNQEYSRDIEPMKGGHTDNYYFQMVGQNRWRKGVRPVPVAGAPQTINLAGGFAQWTNVSPAYYDPVKDTIWRNFPGASAAQMGTYTNTTGRNDFTVLKAARDSSHFYFLAQCDSNLTSHTGSNWMVLFIDADTNHLTGWEGYDLAVNLGTRTASTTTLSQNTSTNNGWSWTPVSGSIAYTVSGNQLMLAIPRAAMGLTNDPVTFDFHWADNFQTNDIADFGVSGDSAPDRRFNYRHQTAVSQPVTMFQDDFESGQQSAWGITWTNGSKWSLTSTTSYSSNHCAYANTANGTANSAMMLPLDTSGMDSLRVSFYYKLHNVTNAQNLAVQYLSSIGWVTIRVISRDQYHPTGQVWGYDEKQDVWLKFVDSRAKAGTNQVFFNPNFAVRIDASGVTTGSQSVWVDDFLVTGTLGVGPTNLIVNGDFMANALAFTAWPGYTGGANPASITGWSNINGGNAGVNGPLTSVGDPFGPTSTGGRTYAFIQHGVNGLAQNLPLTSNATYQLDYDVAARAGNTTRYQVEIRDATQTYYSVSNVLGNNAAFSHVTATFTTPSALNGTPSIHLYNLTVVLDNTIDFANVSLVPLRTNSPTTTSLASSPNPSPTGANVTFTATVSGAGGTPTNAVRFRTNGVAAALVSLDGGAHAAFATSLLPHGSNVITAEYAGDGNFLASTGSLTQVVNTAPVANPLTLGAVSGLPATLPITGGTNVTDADGDLLTVTAVSAPAHGIAGTDGTSATYTATNNFAGADSFNYTVSDIYGGAATNTVTVSVIASSANLNRMSVGLSGGNVVLTYLGIPWSNYALEQALSLSPAVWLPVVTNPAPANGYILFTNAPLSGTNSFWRTRSVP